MESLIKSRTRVANFAEVFTSEEDVKSMCDLVKDETYRIDSKILEPACGDGNFLVEIFSRKLYTVNAKYGKNLYDFEKNSILAASSLYGIDIQEDNANECRERLFNMWLDIYSKKMKGKGTDGCLEAVRFLFNCNILCGDALTLQKQNGAPIVFSEWAFLSGDFMKRRDFDLSAMLKVQESGGQKDLFLSSDDFDIDLGAFVPLPIKDDYRPLKYWQIQEWGL